MRASRRNILAAVLGLSLAVPACKSDRGAAEAGERHPVRAELLVAPVVDDDPWVMAFLTEISITRPPGADARLEGRTGPQGLRHPEPIIEAESREALAKVLAEYEKKHPHSPELTPIWESAPFGPKERVQWRLYFVDRSHGFVVDEQARAGIVEHDHGPSVHVWLGDAQREAFAALTRAQVGRRIAIALDDEALMLPVVMDAVPDGNIQLIANPHEDPAVATNRLLERLSSGSQG
jgi:hypothetical protein